MSTRVKGTFEVKLLPQDLAFTHEQPGLARLSIDKQFRGELDASSKGEMLSAASTTKGSAGYVAIERVTGTLQGKRGSFVLQHSAFMNRGVPSLIITVVPDSGTGELAGLQGSMGIDIVNKEHFYTFSYQIIQEGRETNAEAV
jgi:hypothetical protein